MTRAEPLSLYVHVPFCTLKCSYCDFNSYAGIEGLVPAYVDALIAEMGLWSRFARKGARPGSQGRPVPTVFFGGGTPSLLPIEHLERIVLAMGERFDLDPDAEVTLEANPGTVDLDYLRAMRSLGVNRVSFGVQSFHDDELRALDRIHSAAEAEEAYRWAREAGFERVNLDLIYGLPVLSEVEGPDQRPERWRASLERAIGLAPDHLSLYALTVEDGTKLAYDVDHGRAPEPDADLQAELYEWSCERLAEAGYRQYEISNWALPGQECHHNLVYWRNGEWLGLGPGAHSHLAGTRFADVYSPKQYVEALKAADRPEGDDLPSLLRSMPQVTYVEEPTPELARADTLIMGLRLNEGVSLDEVRRRFGDATPEATFAEMTAAGLLERAPSSGSGQAGRIRLTDRGRLLANEVFVRLLPD